ncbi:Zn cluster transcription factor Rds2 [Histoplasma ohiense]|nr:Zn cluster transcription factor Rds2 [Histoplasma ohiense (nom. inval.)]
MTKDGETQLAKDEGEKSSNGGVLETATPSNSTAERDAQTEEMSTKNNQSPPKVADGTPANSSPKKRRKVNHACVYCRRSHMTCDSDRPCTRCIKRNIGHLCHDEPRENVKRPKSEHETSAPEEEVSSNNDFAGAQNMPRKIEPHEINQVLRNSSVPNLSTSIDHSQSSQPQGISSNPVDVNPQQLMSYNDWRFGTQNQFQDMHTFHPSYMFNHPEVTNEYNLLNDFLSTSLLDDASMYPGEEMSGLYSDSSLLNSMSTNLIPHNNQSFLQQQQQQQAMLPPSILSAQSQTANVGNSIQRPSSNVGNEKAKETYYMTAADPSGTDPPEERMNKLLKAKYDAGLLKPFNYVGGYARLNSYMEKHLEPASRQKILRQLDKFRPKFRERMQSLTDMELLVVEMWFERSLMEYDRVFASMAIPACCWRRTGQIFRGNKEMAQLIDVPIESLRDGKLAIHEIIVEDQLVSYWEKFGAIAFDSTQKAMLTSCTLKSPNSNSRAEGIKCCFSFTIRRDTHNIPSLIVGNFLPMKRTDR